VSVTGGTGEGRAEASLVRLGIELPPPPKPLFSYVPVKIAGGLAYVSGQVPMVEAEVQRPGHLGAEVSVEEGVEAARRCALQALSALRAAVGSLDDIVGIVHVSVFVASAPGFTQQSSVANGASDFLVELFGPEAGSHARFAVGVPELPLNACVEVGLVAQVA
jgi:enamine deaminase RidA (YjgF/YER057c/UK114 family)